MTPINTWNFELLKGITLGVGERVKGTLVFVACVDGCVVGAIGSVGIVDAVDDAVDVVVVVGNIGFCVIYFDVVVGITVLGVNCVGSIPVGFGEIAIIRDKI